METINAENLHAVQLLSSIVKRLKDSQLKYSILRAIVGNLRKVAQYLTLNEDQALVFAVVFALQMNDVRNLHITDIARYLDVNYIDLLTFKTDIDLLISRGFIRTEGVMLKASTPFKNLTFSIDKDILSSIFMNATISEPKPQKELDATAFVRKVSKLLELRSNDEIHSFQLFEIVEDLEAANEKMKMLREMDILNLEIEDRILFYEMCDDFLKGSSTGVSSTLNEIYDEINDRYRAMREIKEQNNKLIKLGVIRLCQGAFVSDAEIELTDKGLYVFMGENASVLMKKTNKNLIPVDKISAKVMFFDEKLDREVKFVQESLQNDKFVNMQERLVEMAMPKGIAAIFYGEPGTGKTETVFQLAKETGRAIMHVDISQSKSMWFGESEKKIKEIFTSYTDLCKTCEVKPILLFNEADAIFGKRKDGNASNLAQTENAIQNIILEEMEKLEGILIATTNLNQNLDAAFERRFLFKIKFDKPSVEAKQKIWQSKLDWLSNTDAQQLASAYSFSGGEIDNIVRKATIEEVLRGVKPDLQQLIQYCDAENYNRKTESRKLGF